MFADLPGYGFARVPERIRATWKPLVGDAISVARTTLRGVVVIVDARRGPRGPKTSRCSSSWNRLRIPAVAVANKIDKLRQGERARALRGAAERACRTSFPFSGGDRRRRARAVAAIDRARRGSLAFAGGEIA